MENQKVRKLVLSALMAALVYVATSIIQIPSPVNGYVNLGDCFVLLSGWLLGKTGNALTKLPEYHIF